jgi:GTP-binding protein
MIRIALIGRPNVGKSTLFNRLVGKRLALVHEKPGMTRDRRMSPARIFDIQFELTDTAGLEDEHTSILTPLMMEQTRKAIMESDIVFFLLDGREGCTSFDKDVAKLLRKSQKPIIALVNKSEGKGAINGIAEAARLGFPHTIPISAEHGEGILDIYDVLISDFNELFEKDQQINDDQSNEKPLKLAIVGKPNVGKSTLINTLLKEDRLLVADQPGVTRDSIAIQWKYKERFIQLTDTAGLRRTAKVDDGMEKLSAMDTNRVIQYSEVVVLIVDAMEGFSRQDFDIAQHVIEEGRALIICLNKWDLVKDRKQTFNDAEEALDKNLSQTSGVTMIPIVGLKGQHLDRLLDKILEVEIMWNKRIATAELNQWLRELINNFPPPSVSGHRFKVKYMTQIKSRPPTFVLFSSKSDELPQSYQRFLLKHLREAFNLEGIPLRLTIKGSANPYKE